MSRVGKQPIPIPQGVEVDIQGNLVTVKGPKGQLTKELHPEISITKEDGQIRVTRPTDQPRHRALHGLTRSLLANMVHGVSKGYEKGLELVGVGYRAAKQGRKLVLTVGYSHPVEIEPEEGIELEVPAPNKVLVKGIDKERVGAVAANLRAIRPPEPYKGKGIKYENEVIRRKAGKVGTKK